MNEYRGDGQSVRVQRSPGACERSNMCDYRWSAPRSAAWSACYTRCTWSGVRGTPASSAGSRSEKTAPASTGFARAWAFRVRTALGTGSPGSGTRASLALAAQISHPPHLDTRAASAVCSKVEDASRVQKMCESEHHVLGCARGDGSANEHPQLRTRGRSVLHTVLPHEYDTELLLT
eukprot:6212313-Pleurochrysis_carterae.AAC.13